MQVRHLQQSKQPHCYCSECYETLEVERISAYTSSLILKEKKKNKIKLEWKINFFSKYLGKDMGVLTVLLLMTWKWPLRELWELSVFSGVDSERILNTSMKKTRNTRFAFGASQPVSLPITITEKEPRYFRPKEEWKKQTNITTKVKYTIMVLRRSTIHLTPIWNKTKQAKLSNLFLNISLEAICSCWGFIKVSYLPQYTVESFHGRRIYFQEPVLGQKQFLFSPPFSFTNLYLLILLIWKD